MSVVRKGLNMVSGGGMRSQKGRSQKPGGKDGSDLRCSGLVPLCSEYSSKMRKLKGPSQAESRVCGLETSSAKRCTTGRGYAGTTWLAHAGEGVQLGAGC